MGKKSTPKAPAAPDYAAAAAAQGTANQDAARQGAELTNTNQVTPYGSQTFTKDPKSDQWTSTVSLSPDQQQIYDTQTQGDIRLGNMANQQLGRIDDSFSQPFDTSGAPSRVNSVDPANYSTYGGADPSYAKFDGSAPNYQSFANSPEYQKFTSQIQDLPDYGKQAQEVEDSLYGSATKKLDPQYAQQEEALRSRLINSGYDPSSEAYHNEMDRFANQKQADYGDARDRAIQGRGAEQSRLNNDFYTGNAQKFGQELQSAGFNNDIYSRNFNENAQANQSNNALQSQGMSDQLAKLGFNNSTDAATLSDRLKTLGFNNSAASQGFNDRIAGGNFQNTNRGAAIDEAAYLRNEPLNAYNALNSGSQVTQPQFRGTGQAQGPAATPTFAATQAQDQRAIDLYNAQLASSGSAQGGLMGMLGNLGSAFINRK